MSLSANVNCHKTVFPGVPVSARALHMIRVIYVKLAQVVKVKQQLDLCCSTYVRFSVFDYGYTCGSTPDFRFNV